MTHTPTHWRSKKLLTFVLTAALLVVGAFFVPPANFSALSIALTSLYGVFASVNTVAGLRGGAPAEVIDPRG